MRARIIIVTLALVAIAAIVLLRRGAGDPEEVRVAHRGAASAPVSHGVDLGAAAGRRADSAAAPKSGGAAPGRDDGGAPRGAREEGAPGSIDRGEALVVNAGGVGKKLGSTSPSRAGGEEDEDTAAAALDAGAAGGKLGEPNAAGSGQGSAHTAPAEAAAAAAAAAAGAEGPAQVPGILFNSTEDQTYATTDPVEIPDSDKFGRQNGSVNFWLEPGWEGDNQDDADFIDLGDGGLKVVKNVNFLRFEYTDANGVSSGVGVEISDWKVGDPRQVTATWDGSTINLYVDGKLVSQRPNPGLQRVDEPGPVTVGSLYPPDRPIAPGVINGVQLFDRPLGPDEVSNLHLTPPKKK